MVSRKKLFVSREELADVRYGIENGPWSKGQRQILMKDIHLIEAALSSDRVVISLDEKARSLFREAAAGIKILADVVWVNPDGAEDHCLSWLKAGAWPDVNLQLGKHEE